MDWEPENRKKLEKYILPIFLTRNGRNIVFCRCLPPQARCVLKRAENVVPKKFQIYRDEAIYPGGESCSMLQVDCENPSLAPLWCRIFSVHVSNNIDHTKCRLFAQMENKEHELYLLLSISCVMLSNRDDKMSPKAKPEPRLAPHEIWWAHRRAQKASLKRRTNRAVYT